MRINTPEDLLEKLELQEENLPTYQTEVGATAADLTEITNDKIALSFAVDRAYIVEAGKKTTNGIKDHIFDGDEDIPVTKYPVFPTDEPPTAFNGGCFQRFMKRNKRFKAANGYTKEIGIALGIDGDTPKASPETVKPTLEAIASQTNYQTAIVVGNRAQSDMWKVFIRRANSETRTEIASGTGKSTDITISPTTDGQPEKVELTVQLYKKNETYGQLSDPVYVTVSP